MIVSLSDNYQSRDVNSAFLLHSTGHKPADSEVDCSINYADYYYLEALLRLQKLNKIDYVKENHSNLACSYNGINGCKL